MTDRNALMELAGIIEESSSEIMEWAAGSSNGGPFSEEIYRTNCQIAGTLSIIAKRIRASLEVER